MRVFDYAWELVAFLNVLGSGHCVLNIHLIVTSLQGRTQTRISFRAICGGLGQLVDGYFDVRYLGIRSIVCTPDWGLSCGCCFIDESDVFQCQMVIRSLREADGRVNVIEER